MIDDIEVEKSYSAQEVASKLRRLANALEQGTPFEIQIGGQRVYVPVDVVVAFEYERQDDQEEVEIELKWTRR